MGGSRFKRTVRVLRIAAWLIAIIWFVWFAYVRWTTPPAKSPKELWSNWGPPRAMVPLIDAIPSPKASSNSHLRLFSRPNEYPLDPTLLTGSWDTDARPELAEADSFASSAEMKSAVDGLNEWLNEFERAGRATSDRLRTDAPDAYSRFYESYYRALHVQVFLARVRADRDGDITGAIQSLRAALRLMSSVGPGYPGLDAVQHEIGCMARRHALPPAAASDLMIAMSDAYTPSVSRVLSPWLDDKWLEELLDTYYTEDEHGDGWLVLSTAKPWPMYPYELPEPNTSRTAAWNLLSPLFYGRKEVRAHVPMPIELGDADSLDHEQLRARLILPNVSTGGLLLGPLKSVSFGITDGTLHMALRCVTKQRAVLVSLALAAYRSDYGEYPGELRLLVPRYIDVIPVEAFTARPFVYSREGEGYRLAPERSLPDIGKSYGTLWPHDQDGLLPARVAGETP